MTAAERRVRLNESGATVQQRGDPDRHEEQQRQQQRQGRQALDMDWRRWAGLQVRKVNAGGCFRARLLPGMPPWAAFTRPSIVDWMPGGSRECRQLLESGLCYGGVPEDRLVPATGTGV